MKVGEEFGPPAPAFIV